MMKDIIDKVENTKTQFLKTQEEKCIYLGEFKENVLAALEKKEVENNNINDKIEEAMKDSRAKLLKIRRDIPFDNIKQYIEKAEELHLKYTLVDDISFVGEVGLVVVSKESLNNKKENVIVDSDTKIYTDAGLDENYLYAEGKKISNKYFEELEKKLPTQIHKFKKMNLFDKIIGTECAIDRAKKKER